MQGFSQIGQGAGQFADAQRQMTEQNKPIDPQLEQFARARMRQAIERINAGGDPKMEAINYRNDLANILKGGPNVSAPQVNVPNIVDNTVGPSSPVGNAPAVGGSAFSGNAPVKSMTVSPPPQTDLSGNVPYKPEPQAAPQAAPAPQPRPQPQPSNRINQTLPQPKQQAPMSRREFEDFAKMNPQFQSMDQIEMTRQSGQNKIQLAEQNNIARAMIQQAEEAGLDKRAAAALVLKAQQIEASSGIKVFDIMMRVRGLNATLASRERVAAMTQDQKLQYAKMYTTMLSNLAKAKAAAIAVGDNEGANLAQAGMDAAVQGSNILGITNIEDGITDPGSPAEPGLIFDTPAIPPTTGPVAKPLPASPVPAPKTGTSTSKSTKTQTRRQGLGL